MVVLAFGTLTGGTVQALPSATSAAHPAAASPARVQAAPVTPAALPVAKRAYGYALKVAPRLRALGSTEWNGSYDNGGLEVYCPDYGLKRTYIRPGAPVAALPGKSVAVSRKIFYVVNRYGVTTSNTQAAAVHVAIEVLTGDPAWAADWKAYYLAEQNRIDPKVTPLAARFVAEAKIWFGPYSLSAPAFDDQPLVGQSSTASVQVQTGAHVGLPKVAIRWTATGAVITRNSTSTDAKGVSRITFRRTSTGKVTVFARALNLPSYRGTTGPVPAGFQHVVGKAPGSNLSSQASYQVSPAGVGLVMSCTSSCNGRPPVTMCGSDPTGAAKMQYVPIRNGVIDYNHGLVLVAGRSGCIVFIGRDGETIGVLYRYFVDGRWTALRDLHESILIDCPALPNIAVNIACNCVGGPVGRSGTRSTIVFVVPVNSTRHNWKMVVSSSVSGNHAYLIRPGKGFRVGFTATGTFGLSIGAQKGTGAWTSKKVFTGLKFG